MQREVKEKTKEEWLDEQCKTVGGFKKKRKMTLLTWKLKSFTYRKKTQYKHVDKKQYLITKKVK